MNYKNLTERLGKDDLQMIEDVQQYLIDTKDLKGDARTSAEGIMNSSFGDMQELENAYNSGGAEAGAEYVLDNLPKAAIRKYLKESMQSLNEGQFSWMTQDTDQQIGSERENMIDVWMFDDKGNSWYEKSYDGYGEFGGMDYYELIAIMNGYTEDDLKSLRKKNLRLVGIDLAFDKLGPADNAQKDVLFPALVSNPRFNWKRHDFTQEAESDPNQSWYQEPEDSSDYDEDWADEHKYVPSYLKFVNENLNHVKKYKGFLNENQVGFEVIWQDENKEHGLVVVADLKDAEREFKKRQKEGVIKVQINKLTKRASSFSDEEQERWVNRDPKFRTHLNSRMSTEDSSKYIDFLKQRNATRDEYFKKAK